ncbi:MAG TPA: hypothetical protein VFR97_09035 [Capillimicrobium sp.]|nr:hypothetical protein [Capillimicrobium sp.]
MRVSLSTTTLAVLVLAAAAAPTASAACDPVDPSLCLYPWPSNAYTTKDTTTDTGLRLSLKPSQMPRNVDGTPIDPTQLNRNDGFSPGTAIVTRVPGLDNEQAFEKTGAVPITDMARAFDRDQPVVLINTRTHQRHLIWSEIDANPADREDVTLIIRPGKNLEDGTRYVVALRNLKNAQGKTLRPQPAFRKQRDAKRPSKRYRRIFKDLRKAKIARDDLYLAWDFTVASERNLTERVLSIRDAAFAELGDTNLADLRPDGHSPAFTVDSVTDFTVEQDPNIARQVTGTVTVPCFLDQPGCPPGSGFRYASATSNIPQRIPGNTIAAEYVCNIPRVAMERPARPGIYGHGLLGKPTEINQLQLKSLSQEHDFVFCATSWKGMANEDIIHVAGLLNDLSRFSTVPDRLQQGYIDQLYLGRAMIRPDGLSSHPAFQNGAGQPVLDTAPGRLYYDGNSQGGIMGGALTAIAPDFDRAVLGVPGMNFSTLLRRSVDFNTYAQILYKAYPDELERPLILSLIQLVWDRGEANGYANHMTTDPLPDTPQHRVLMHVALGDHQVANVTADVEARTIGAATLPNPVAPGRFPDREPLYGIPRIRSFPYDGSAIVYWDSGTPTPPTQNVPPTGGTDPHETPRNDAKAREQKSAFLQIGGKVVDVCGGGPCTAVDPG